MMNLSRYYFILTILTFGAFTSCGNILENSDPGMAEGLTGELHIDLQTDATLQVNTKATTDVQETNIDTYKGTLSFTMTPKTGTTVPNGTTLPTVPGTYIVPIGSYTFQAKNDKVMNNKFAWNHPVLASVQEERTISHTTPVNLSLTCTLQNSIIAVDAAAWTALLGTVDVTAFQVVDMENVPAYGTAITGGTSLLASGSTTKLQSGMLYAKSDLANVKIVLDGKLKDTTDKTFRAVAPVKPSDTATTIGAKNKYNVSFNLDESKGTLTLSIVVDTNVTPVDIVIPIIPESESTQ